MKYFIGNKHWDIVEDYNFDKLLYLLIDRPSHITPFNEFIWLNNKGEDHRSYDLPAFSSHMEYYAEWRTDDLLHRINNKPAIVYGNGVKLYWINGSCIKTEEPK